jgi:hypothetical protein
MNGHMAIELTSSPSWALSLNGGNPLCFTCRFDLCCPSTSARGRTRDQASTCVLIPTPASIEQASQRSTLPPVPSSRSSQRMDRSPPALGSRSGGGGDEEMAWLAGRGGTGMWAQPASRRRGLRVPAGHVGRGNIRFHALAPGIFVTSPT